MRKIVAVFPLISAAAVANLQHSMLLRAIAIAGQLCALGNAGGMFHARLPLPRLLAPIFLLVVVNVATLLSLRNRTAVSALTFAAHVLVDVAAGSVFRWIDFCPTSSTNAACCR